MQATHLNLILVMFTVVLMAGCTVGKTPEQAHRQAQGSDLADCAQWLVRLEASIQRAGVRDAAAAPVEGYPYLRSNRFGASFADTVMPDEQLGQAWLAYLQDLDASGRRFEISNLPESEVGALGAADRAVLLARIRDCGERLAEQDLPAGLPSAELVAQVRVDDHYSNGMRALGLYELTRIPFHAGVKAWQERARQTIDETRQGMPPQQPLTGYAPPADQTYSRTEVQALLADAAAHPLGIVELTVEQRARLFATYAPRFEIETGGEYDRIGRMGWDSEGLPRVDTSIPTVYRRIDYTRVDGSTLIQLVYLAWFPERPEEHGFDLLAGRLDGLVWRVTLAPDGSPVLYDTIHPCGCYHQFITTPRVQPLPPPEDAGEWAFVPTTLPLMGEGERVVVSLQTRTHYLRDVRLSRESDGLTYMFADYDELRTMPLADGGSRSLFAANGLVAGSERGERFLFWPMGIASAGAMRQSGTQATAFVGRRHFDDADLVEKRFRLLD